MSTYPLYRLPIAGTLVGMVQQELEQKAERCVVQLSNAEKLIGGLGGEEKRWKDTVATLTLAMDKLPGEWGNIYIINFFFRLCRLPMTFLLGLNIMLYGCNRLRVHCGTCSRLSYAMLIY